MVDITTSVSLPYLMCSDCCVDLVETHMLTIAKILQALKATLQAIDVVDGRDGSARRSSGLRVAAGFR